MLYNVTLIFQAMSIIALLVTSTMISVNSQVLCYTITFVVMQAVMISEAIATFILAHVTCAMYCSSKLQPGIHVKKLLVCYAASGVLMQCLFTFFIVETMGYCTHVLLTNGFCTPLSLVTTL